MGTLYKEKSPLFIFYLYKHKHIYITHAFMHAMPTHVHTPNPSFHARNGSKTKTKRTHTNQMILNLTASKTNFSVSDKTNISSAIFAMAPKLAVDIDYDNLMKNAAIPHV